MWMVLNLPARGHLRAPPVHGLGTALWRAHYAANMSFSRSAASHAGKRLAPTLASSYVRGALNKAIDGLGPLPSAAASANTHLVDADGDVEAAIVHLVRRHILLAGAQGFVTNLGGLIAVPIAVPANLIGVTLVQAHLIAGIAHLRGYDLGSAGVRNAILVCMLGEDSARALMRQRNLPNTVTALIDASTPELEERVSKEVTADLIARTAGRRVATLIGRRIPLLGGVVGAGADGLTTWQLGLFARKQLTDRNLPRPPAVDSLKGRRAPR